MTWFFNLFRREPAMPETFRKALGWHILATTFDGVGSWARRG
jgi:hypothetical protein